MDEALVAWADEIVFVNKDNYDQVTQWGEKKFDLTGKAVYVLNVPDRFQYRDPQLLEIIKQQLKDKGFPEHNGIQTIPQDPEAVAGYRGQRED